MYTSIDFKTKKELKEAIKQGRIIYIFAPGLGKVIQNGVGFVEGPHYPKPHTWYAQVKVKDGIIIKIIE